MNGWYRQTWKQEIGVSQEYVGYQLYLCIYVSIICNYTLLYFIVCLERLISARYIMFVPIKKGLQFVGSHTESICIITEEDRLTQVEEFVIPPETASARFASQPILGFRSVHLWGFSQHLEFAVYLPKSTIIWLLDHISSVSQ